MNILVTGGLGFIGSNLVDRLLKDGHNVVVIDDFSTGKEENLIHNLNNKNLTLHNANICSDIDKYFKNIDIVFHVAAIPRVQYSIQNPKITNKVNIEGTLNVLLAAKKNNVKRFIFSSSNSVYGDQKPPFIETMQPKPISPYALQKLTGENYCRLFYEIYKLETISLRYFNVYGRRQDPEGDYATLISKFIKIVKENKRPVINGDGEQTRDFTNVKDVVEANILAAFTENKEAIGEIFNIGCGKNHSVNHVTKLIIGNKDIKPIHGPSVIEPRDSRAGNSKAKRLLNWEPKISLENGLKEMIGHFFSI